MGTLLMLALLAPPPGAWGSPPTSFAHPATLQLHLNDDVKASFGNTAAAPDAWWDNNSTAMCWTSTSVDGGGTDGDLVCYTLGGNALTFSTTTVTFPAAGALVYSGRAKLTSPADGNLILANNAGTQGVLFDTATTDAKLRLLDESSGALTVVVNEVQFGASSGNLLNLSGLQFAQQAITVGTIVASGTSASNATTLRSGAQTNAGDYASGPVNVYSGDTTTDGNSGPVSVYSGVAGAGAADAGDTCLGVNGTCTALVVDGPTGATQVSGGSSKGASTNLKTKTESVTFAADPGDATKATTGSIIPAGAFVVGVSGRVTTGNTGGCTSIDIGIAAKDTDAFADGIAVALNTTFTTASGNAGAIYGNNSTDATALDLLPSIAAQEITVTAVGGDGACDDMVVALTVHYIDVTAATSN